MILTDCLIDRLHGIKVATLRLTAQGVAATFEPLATADIGTGFALFAGDGSPLTQITGFAHRTSGDVRAIESFFRPLTDDWEIAVTPFTDPNTVRHLLDVGYRPGQFEGTLAQRIDRLPEMPPFEIVEVEDDLGVWMEATGRGWTGDEGVSFEPDALVRAVSHIPSRRYLALVDGVPAATASMMEIGDAVMLGGAATRVPYRGRGLQTALLARRLRDAGPGRLAVIGAVPGTQSYRNAQRAGFTPMYSTLTLMRR